MVRRKRKTRRRRKSMRGGYFQVGTIVRWKRNAKTKAANQHYLESNALLRQGYPTPEWLRRSRSAREDAIRQEEGWRGVIVAQPGIWDWGGRLGPHARGRDDRFMVQWVRSLSGAYGNRPPLGGGQDLYSEWWGAHAPNPEFPSADQAFGYFIVPVDRLDPVRRPTGNIARLAARAARLRFREHPELAPRVAHHDHSDKNRRTARLVAARRLAQAAPELGHKIAGFIGNKPILPASERTTEGTAAVAAEAEAAAAARLSGDQLAIQIDPTRTVDAAAKRAPDPAAGYWAPHGKWVRAASTFLQHPLTRFNDAGIDPHHRAAARAVLEEEKAAMAERDADAPDIAEAFSELPGTGSGGRRRRRRRQSRRRKRRRRTSRRTRSKR